MRTADIILNLGDIVQLRTPPPPEGVHEYIVPIMWVAEVSECNVTVIWYATDLQLQRATLRKELVALKYALPSEESQPG